MHRRHRPLGAVIAHSASIDDIEIDVVVQPSRFSTRFLEKHQCRTSGSQTLGRSGADSGGALELHAGARPSGVSWRRPRPSRPTSHRLHGQSARGPNVAVDRLPSSCCARSKAMAAPSGDTVSWPITSPGRRSSSSVRCPAKLYWKIAPPSGGGLVSPGPLSLRERIKPDPSGSQASPVTLQLARGQVPTSTGRIWPALLDRQGVQEYPWGGTMNKPF